MHYCGVCKREGAIISLKNTKLGNGNKLVGLLECWEKLLSSICFGCLYFEYKSTSSKFFLSFFGIDKIKNKI